MTTSRCSDKPHSDPHHRDVWPLVLALGAAIIANGMAPGRAAARIPLDHLGLGRLEVSGNIQTTNIIRHPDFDRYMFIQQRNVLRTRVDWELIRGGSLLDRFRVPGIRKANLFLLYRFAYDSIYDYTPNFRQDFDVHGIDLQRVFDRDGVPRKYLKLDGLSEDERDAYKFENTIREAYVDLKFRRIPLSLRIGRQQVVWGETDNFRMLDRVNPLDVSWHFAQEVPAPSFGWDEIRRPLWMLKGLYNFGNFGPLSQVFTEFYWNPGDWYPVKLAFLPRPWGIPILDPLTNPWDGAFVVGPCLTSRDRRCHELMNDTELFKQGDYDLWDPVSNSQVGIRFHATTPQGLEFTLNYLHQRWSGDDGTDYAPVKALRIFKVNDVVNDPAAIESGKLLRQGILPAEFIAPYINTVGLAANYSDETYTQTVYRLETVVDFGIPFFDRGKLTVLDDFLPGVTEKNMWKGMIGFDRPTWIRSLNKKSSFFVTGQFFWHYLINNPSCPDDLSNPAALQKFIARGGHCLTGGFDLPSARRPKSVSFRDKIRDWEVLATIALVSFYRGGSVVPVMAYAVDPMNRYVGELIWAVDWFVTPSVAVNVAQRLFINPIGTKVNFDPWGFGSLSRGRSETSLRLTYQF